MSQWTPLERLVLGLIVAVLGVGGLVLGTRFIHLDNLQRGHILYTTSDLKNRRECVRYFTDGSCADRETPNGDLCVVEDAVTSVPAGTHLFVAEVWTQRPNGFVNGQETTTRNGQPIYQGRVSIGASDCFLTELLGPSAGQYHTEITVDGRVIAQGDLTVT